MNLKSKHLVCLSFFGDRLFEETNILYLYRSWIEKTVWKFETEGLRIRKILKLLEQFILTVKIFCQFETINVTIGTTNLDVEINN